MIEFDALTTVTVATGAAIAVTVARVGTPTSRARAVVDVTPRRLSTTPRRGVRHLAAVASVVVAVVLLGPLLAAAIALAAFVAHRTGPWRERRRRRLAIERWLPDAIDLLIVTIRAGSTPRQAVEALADTTDDTYADAFAAVVHRTRRGQPFADALTALSELLGSSAAPVVDAIASCERYGLPLEPMLDQLTTEARATRRRLDQADARKLPVRLSFPLVACTLPSFVLLAIAPAVIAALSSLGTSAP